MATENLTVDGTTIEGGQSGGEVTYVGGRAVEQTTEGETHEGTDHGNELEAAKAAVKAALDAEAKRSAKDSGEGEEPAEVDQPKARGKGGKFVSDKTPAEREVEQAKAKLAKEMSDAEGETPEAPEAAPKKDEEDASALRKALAERKELARLKAEAAAEVEKARQEARQFYQQLQREKQEVERERARLELLRKDPVKAIKENGWDPEDFIMDIASDGTPEGQARRQQRELQRQIEELHTWKREQAEAAQKAAQQAKAQEIAQYRRQVEQQFLNAAAERTAEGAHKNRHLVTMYKDDPEGLIVQADLVAERYRQATGEEATFAMIAEYLEEQAAKWYKSLSSSAPQVGAPVTQGKPTPGTTGKRSLSPDGSSERRSLGTSFKDLDGDERRAAAMDAVRAALRASGER